jgi:Carboxypeptidase regulatory-like domain
MIFNRSQEVFSPIRGAESFPQQNTLACTAADKSRFALRVMICLICLFAIGGELMAQKGLATLRGTISDPSGATVSGAILKLVDPTSKITRNITTKDNGIYEFGAVNPGIYRLEVKKVGFKDEAINNILLEDGRVSVKDVLLTVGADTQEVTVKDTPDVITSDTGELRDSFDSDRIKLTPTNDQNPGPEALLSSLPGITASGYSVQISGQGANQLVLNYDGLQNREGNQNVNINFFSEFTAVTSNATAEWASAVNENSTSKRGTDDFHGGVSYRMFNNTFNASGYFSPQKNHSLMDEVIGELGGPIVRDKTFFYVGFMKQLYYAGTYNQGVVPTAAERNGDFGSIPIIDPITNAPFPNNEIPASRLSPVALATQNSYIPLPNQNLNNPNGYNYGWVEPFPSDIFEGTWWFARVDQQITSNNSLSVRFSSKGAPYVLANQLPDFFRTISRYNNQITIADTHIFSPLVVNEFQIARNYLNLTDGKTEGGQTPLYGASVIQQIGLQGIDTTGIQGIQGSPDMNISGYADPYLQSGGILDDEHDLVVQDALTWSHGKHVFKFGGNFINYKTAAGVVPDFGSFSFDGSFTGNGYADFLLGLPRTSERSNPIYNQAYASKEAGLFAQDSFKITPLLTVDYGLRWDYYGLPYYTDNLGYNWNINTGDIVVSPSALNQVSPLFPTNIKVVGGQVPGNTKLSNFHPRLSAAYRLKPDMVIRGGYGEFTERFGISARAYTGGPFGIAQNYTNVNESGSATGALFAFPNPYPASLSLAASPSQSVNGYPLGTDNGTIRQYNVSLEQRIFRDVGLRFSYIGSHGSGLNYQANINLQRPSLTPYNAANNPWPQFNSISYWFSNGTQKYNSGQVEVQRRTGWFGFDGHYTWASNLNDYSDTENPYDILSHWSKDGTTRRHVGVIDTYINLPFGRGRSYMNHAPAWMEQALGGWNLQSISYFGSGLYMGPTYSGADPSNTGTFGGIASRVLNVPIYPAHKTPTSWFNPAAFTVPAPGTFGNAGVDSIEGQGLLSTDLSVNKTFRVTDRVHFVLTGAASNIFNRPGFNDLDLNIEDPTAGQYYDTIPDYVGDRSGRRMPSIKGRIEF